MSDSYFYVQTPLPLILYSGSFEREIQSLLAVGVRGPIHSESGMILNLMEFTPLFQTLQIKVKGKCYRSFQDMCSDIQHVIEGWTSLHYKFELNLKDHLQILMEKSQSLLMQRKYLITWSVSAVGFPAGGTTAQFIDGQATVVGVPVDKTSSLEIANLTHPLESLTSFKNQLLKESFQEVRSIRVEANPSFSSAFETIFS